MEKNKFVLVGKDSKTGNTVYLNSSNRWSESHEIAYRFIRKEDCLLVQDIIEKSDSRVSAVIFMHEKEVGK